MVEARRARPMPAGLDREVLELLAQGMTNKEIAKRLVITGNTVKRHLKAIFEKLGVHTRAAAAAARVASGQVPAGRGVDEARQA